MPTFDAPQLKAMRDQLKSKADVVLTLAQEMENPSDTCTKLQRAVQVLLPAPASTAGVAMLLAMQAEVLPQACGNTFVQQTKEFFAHAEAAGMHAHLAFAAKEVADVAHKVGASVSVRFAGSGYGSSLDAPPPPLPAIPGTAPGQLGCLTSLKREEERNRECRPS